MTPRHMQNLFRCFGLDPLVPGDRILSNILLIHAVLYLLLTVGIFVYVFLVFGILADTTVASILTALIIGAILLFHIALQSEVIWKRYRMMHVLNSMPLHMRTERLSPGILFRIFIQFVVLSVHVALYLVFFRVSFVSFLIYPINIGNKMRCVQIIFYIDHIGHRVDSVNAGLSRLLCTSSAQHMRDAVARAATVRALQHQKMECAHIARYTREFCGAVGLSMLAMAMHCTAQVVVNSYVICSALITDGIPRRVWLASVYGIFPELLMLLAMCTTCERCVLKV